MLLPSGGANTRQGTIRACLPFEASDSTMSTLSVLQTIESSSRSSYLLHPRLVLLASFSFPSLSALKNCEAEFCTAALTSHQDRSNLRRHREYRLRSKSMALAKSQQSTAREEAEYRDGRRDGCRLRKTIENKNDRHSALPTGQFFDSAFKVTLQFNKSSY